MQKRGSYGSCWNPNGRRYVDWYTYLLTIKDLFDPLDSLLHDLPRLSEKREAGATLGYPRLRLTNFLFVRDILALFQIVSPWFTP